MNPFSPLAAARRLGRDRGGNFSMLFGLSALALVMSAGVAVELTRSLTERSAMANALDAAVLATARDVATGRTKQADADAQLRRMFLANMGQVTEGASATYRIENVRFDAATETLTATAAHDYEGVFRFFGDKDSRILKTESAATYGSTRAEVAMTFDVTGSMRGTKLSSLQEAARAGIDELLSQNLPGRESVRISAIPYAEAVNVGALASYVYPDAGNANDEPPSLADFLDELRARGYSVSTGGRTARRGGGVGIPATGPDNCSTEREGDRAALSSVGPDVAMVNRDKRLKKENCPSAVLLPLTSNGNDLKATVASFRANGYTAGQIGIQWAWYTLSHHWAAYMPAGSGASADKDVRKYAIIMTDGEFNTAFAGVTGGQTDMRQGPAAQQSAKTAVNLCTNMKAEGIEIFTIGFQLKEKEAFEVLQACASPDRPDVKFYYETESGAELVGAYRDIAATINALRLVR